MIKAYMHHFATRWQCVLSLVLIGWALAGCSRGEKPTAPTPGTAAESQPVQDERTELDKYVAAPDTNYSFHVVNTIRGNGFTTYILDMTSQAWLTTNEVDRPLWKHWVIIVRPDTVTHSNALLLIGGGGNDGRIPKSADASLIGIALATKSVVAELKMVPNQPLVLPAKPRGEKRMLSSLIPGTSSCELATPSGPPGCR